MWDKIKSFLRGGGFYLLFFALVSITACFFPPSGDDLGWATSQGWTLLERGFDNYNGRYLGNIAALFLTRIPALLPFIKAAVMTAILYIIEKFSGCRRSFLYLAAVLLMFPLRVFIQAFVWTAGFANYFLPLPLIALCLHLVLVHHPERGIKRVAACAALVLAAFSAQLFMETYTIFSVLISVGVLVLFAVRRKVSIESVLYPLASIGGAALMFSNSVYRKVFSGEDAYQHLTAGDGGIFEKLLTAVKNLFGQVSVSAIEACALVLVVILVLCILLLKRCDAEKRQKRRVWALFISAIPAAICILPLYLITRDIEKALCAVGVSLLLIIAGVAATASVCCEKRRRDRVLLLMLLVLIGTAPLCVVFPVGPRCFAGAYVLLILLAHELYASLPETKVSAKAIRVTAVLLACIMCVDIFAYSQVFFSVRQKIETIETSVAAGETTIVLDHTRFYFLVYAIDRENFRPKFMQRFCEYYGLPDDIQIEYRPLLSSDKNK